MTYNQKKLYLIGEGILKGISTKMSSPRIAQDFIRNLPQKIPNFANGGKLVKYSTIL